MSSLLDLIFSKNDRDKILFITEENKISYNQFINDIKKIAYKINRFNENRIAIGINSSYEWIALFFAIIYAGKTPLILNELLESKEKIAMSKLYGSLLVEDISFIKKIINDKESNQLIEPSKNIQDIIFFTSGTTGLSKGVVLSQESIITDLNETQKIIKLSKSTMVNVLPFSHIFGFFVGILLTIISDSITVVLYNNKNFFKYIQKYEPDVLFLTAEIIQNAKSNIELLGKNIKTIFLGGSGISPKIIEDYKKMGITINTSYGMTECSPVIAVSSYTKNKINSSGYVIPCNKIKLAEDNEILIKGKTVFKGYLLSNNNLELLGDQWFHTGDIGYIQDNYIYILGRKKNIIVLYSGIKVHPEQIEHRINTIDNISDSLVYSIDNLTLNISVILNDKVIDLNIIKYKIKQELKLFPDLKNTIVKIEFVDNFLQTSLGKKQRRN